MTRMHWIGVITSVCSCLAAAVIVTTIEDPRSDDPIPALASPHTGVQASHRQTADASSESPDQDAARELIASLVARHSFNALTPIHQQVALDRAHLMAEGAPMPFLCFAPDTPDEVARAFTFGAEFNMDQGGPRYQQIGRWNSTANGGTGGQGTPITLTYGFPPDGTTVPEIAGVSFPSGINDFNAWMNGIYGSPLDWRPIYADIFARWSELCGLTYVYEPNDDGVPMNENPGILGVRADLRIGGKFLDGNSNVLAYNNFPDDGDMVFDTGDNYYNDTSGNSLKLRNITAHEHGHGMGQLHVCPIEQTKLMEPFISTAYDGPRHDDIGNAQRHYGDPNEPDNSTGAATDIGAFSIGGSITVGTVPAPAVSSGTTLSIDANGEQDFFRFTANTPSAVTVTVIPVGLNYDDSPQACVLEPGWCCNGSFTNSLTIADLNVQIIDTNGSTVLATGDAPGPGSTERLADIPLPVAGSYYIRVYEGNTPSESQLYTFDLFFDSLPSLPPYITLPSGAPDTLAPGLPTPFDVVLDPGDENILPGTELLYYRYDAGAFLTSPLALVAGTLYTATLPAAACGDSPEFYLSGTGDVTGEVTNPASGAAAPYTALVTTGGAVVRDDDMEADDGWSVGDIDDDATTGIWNRMDPESTEAQPEDDHTPAGTDCWVTDGDAGTGLGDRDIDGGKTTLFSPIFDATAGDTTVSYWRWYSNDTGAEPNTDVFVIDISNNGGGAWTNVETVGPAGVEASAGWFFHEFLITDTGLAPTANMQMRFVASDEAPGSLVEAAIDDFLVTSVACEAVAVPAAPTNVLATDDSLCDNVQITWDAVLDADDYEVWRSTVDDPGTATQLVPLSVPGTSFDDGTADAGTTYFYWAKACNVSGCSGFSTSDSGSADTAPNAPTGLIATDDTVCAVIELTWNAAAGTNTYRAWRNTIDDSGSATEIGNTGGTTLSDNSTDPAQTYFYWVTAENGCGQSGFSTPDTGSATPKGDFDLDSAITGDDIQGFVDAQTTAPFFSECADLAAPFGVLDTADTAAFIALLLGP